VATLRIELQDGFEDDEVVCTVDGREVARQSAVRTDLRINRAASLEAEVPDAPLALGIEVPTRDLATELRLDPRQHPYVGVRIVGGRLEATPLTDAPFFL
jgi:hypothetical protein